MISDVERVARIYYRDYADERESMKTWADLAEDQKQYWRQFAKRRLERDS